MRLTPCKPPSLSLRSYRFSPKRAMDGVLHNLSTFVNNLGMTKNVWKSISWLIDKEVVRLRLLEWFPGRNIMVVFVPKIELYLNCLHC